MAGRPDRSCTFDGRAGIVTRRCQSNPICWQAKVPYGVLYSTSLRSATDPPGIRTDSGTRPPESGSHLGLVSRIGARSGEASRARAEVAASRRKAPNVDECDRGSPVGPCVPRACRQARADHRADQHVRRRHRARVRRAQGAGSSCSSPRPAPPCRRWPRSLPPEALEIKVYGAVRRDSDEIVRFAKAAVTGLRRARRGDQPGAAGYARPRPGGDGGRRGAPDRRAAAAAVPPLADRRQPHEPDADRRAGPQRRRCWAAGPAPRAVPSPRSPRRR